MTKYIAAAAVILALTAWGGLHLVTRDGSSAPNTGRAVLSVYTTGQATTPQMPFWRAVAKGDLGFDPEVHYWKNLDDLRGLLLAGKGDIWVGHVDGFAQAAMRGAPVRLVCVTGWKKFYLLSARPDVASFADVMALPPGTEIASTPPHSPGVAVLRALERHGLPGLAYAPHEPKQLTLKALRGDADLLLVPEPLVTVLLTKAPRLSIVAGVEEEYGRLTGAPPVLPIAGIAVNTETLEQHPGLEAELAQAMARRGAELEADPRAGLDTLPKAFEQFIPRPLVLKSLARDVIRVRPARDCKDMILGYLDMILPQETRRPLPEGFFGGGR